MKPKLDRDYRVDYLRAISIIMVLIWHIKPFEFYISRENSFAVTIIIILNAIIFHCILSAVPLFFVISLYLYFKKAKQGFSYFIHRFSRVFTLFAFWFSIQILFYFSATKSVPGFSIKLFLFGGPTIPMIGTSVFYFLSDLLILIFLSYVFLKVPEKLKPKLGFAIILITFIYFETVLLCQFRTDARDIYNFICYIPLGYYLFHHRQHIGKYRYHFLFFFLLFLFHDQYLFYLNYSYPIYSRISVVFGALFFFSFVFHLKPAPNSIMKWISFYSLGIFALHKYCLYFNLAIVENWKIKATFFSVSFNSGRLMLFALTIILTLISVHILGKTPLKRFVS